MTYILLQAILRRQEKRIAKSLPEKPHGTYQMTESEQKETQRRLALLLDRSCWIHTPFGVFPSFPPEYFRRFDDLIDPDNHPADKKENL